jgi:hypothetical protein
MPADDAAVIEILRRMFEDAKRLAAHRDDPVLEGRAGFLVAYLHDVLRLKDPFASIGNVVDYE